MTPSGEMFDSLASFVDQVSRVGDEWRPAAAPWYLHLWFRGIGDADFKLQPGICRYEPRCGLGAEYYTESNLLEMFKLRAYRYLDRVPRNDWEWLFLMQHYGLPTRLLDWTESALMGLYFAVRGHYKGKDAAVWVVNPWWINRVALGDYDLFPADSDKAGRWSVHTPEKERPLPAIAIAPVYASARIQTQRGFFTIHGQDPDGLEKLATLQETYIRKLVLPSSSVDRVLRDLAVLGVTESLAFPELDGLGRELKRRFFGP